jgi:hypothetical protein
MISKTEVSASYRHISLKILREFPKVLKRVSFELGQQESQFRISMQTPVENPLMTIESFNRQFQLGEKESCYAMRHAPCAMRFSISGRPSLRDYQPRRVIGCRRLGNGVGDGEIKNRGYPLGKKFVSLAPEGTSLSR